MRTFAERDDLVCLQRLDDRNNRIQGTARLSAGTALPAQAMMAMDRTAAAI
jgi:hypothetical protein